MGDVHRELRPRSLDDSGAAKETQERRRAAREQRDAQIEVETKTIPVPPDRCVCPSCGATELGVVGEGKESSVVDYVQGHFRKRRYLRDAGTDEHLALRRERSRALFAQLRLWARASVKGNGPRTKLGKAANYLLTNFRERGRFPRCDTNAGPVETGRSTTFSLEIDATRVALVWGGTGRLVVQPGGDGALVDRLTAAGFSCAGWARAPEAESTARAWVGVAKRGALPLYRRDARDTVTHRSHVGRARLR